MLRPLRYVCNEWLGGFFSGSTIRELESAPYPELNRHQLIESEGEVHMVNLFLTLL